MVNLFYFLVEKSQLELQTDFKTSKNQWRYPNFVKHTSCGLFDTIFLKYFLKQASDLKNC